MKGALRPALFAVALMACSRPPVPTSTDAHRVVSLGPATTEALFAIGAGDCVVARSSYCDWPPEAKALPAVGGLQPDVEAILSLGPDLVVGPSGQWSTPLRETMGAHGIATWFPPEIDSLAGVDALLVSLGDKTGHTAEAERLVQNIDAREQVVAQALEHSPKVRVLLVVGVAPIVAAGPKTFADEVLRRVGATNVVTDGGAWPSLGFERVLELDPDVVVDASVGETGGATQITTQVQGWAGVRAVREGRVVPLADERVLRPGPRIAEGVAMLARQLHPGVAIP